MECVVIIVGVVGIAIIIAVAMAVNLERAKKAYYASLEELKKDPHNPDLREATLALGRKYAAAARSMGKVEIFDEVALMNDINAACARAGSRVTIAADERKPSVEERLKRLEELRAKQLVTEAEYEKRRQAILDEI